LRKVLSLLAILSIFLCSCEENISYLGEFEQQYSLNCILRSDKDIQLATIKKSYPPGQENQNSDVQNAIIRLILPDTTLIFKDSVLTEPYPENSSVNSFYYIDNYRLTKNTVIKIEALLPDGTVLTSETTSPNYFRLRLLGDPMIIPDENSSDVYFFNWDVFGNYVPLIFGPSFYVSYFISGYEEIIHYKKATGKHIQQLDRYEVPIVFIDQAMQDISIGIDDKTKINIIGACFEVKVYDTALGIYANSIQTFEDEFSIRISEPNISNINGGFGIFGTYISEKFDIGITSDYISSFGYTPAPIGLE
jgi:hypothetical protein